MAFWNKLGSVFGFNEDDADEDYIVRDNSSEDDSTPKTVVEINTVTDGEIPEGVFDGLIEIINSNLSPMVLQCLDVEAEKKYLYQALGPRFSQFVKQTREQSLNAARVEWDKEKSDMKHKIDEYKGRCVSAETEMNEMKAMKMSDERQRLALKERIRKLEEQVAEVEADKEQRIIENKSLLNRLKVLQVRNGSDEEGDKLVLELSEKLELAQKTVEEVQNALREKEVALAEVTGKEAECRDKLIEAEKATEALRAEVATLKEVSIVQELSDDEKQSIAETEAKLTEAQVKITQLEEQLQAAKDEVSQMNDGLSMLDEIQAQLEKVEEFKEKKNEEITALKKEIEDMGKSHELAVEMVRIEELDKFTHLENEKGKEISNLQNTIKALETEIVSLKQSIEAAQLSAEEMASREKSLSDDLALSRSDVEKAMVDIDALRNELDEANALIDEQKDKYLKELSEVKGENLQKVNELQAEIAQLQAKLDLNVATDDSLVDDDLKQVVEDTFGINVDDRSFIEFELSETNDTEDLSTIASDAEIVNEPVLNDDSDIDWLLPEGTEFVDDAEVVEPEEESLAVEDESKVVSEEKAVEEEKTAIIDTQMSLFG